MNYRFNAEVLAWPPTESTKSMGHGERVRGIEQMLHDLERLAREDGCVAAAWALERLLAESVIVRTEAAERIKSLDLTHEELDELSESGPPPGLFGKP